MRINLKWVVVLSVVMLTFVSVACGSADSDAELVTIDSSASDNDVSEDTESNILDAKENEISSESAEAEDNSDDSISKASGNVLMEDSKYLKGKVLGSDISRNSVGIITFLDSLENAAQDAWDVSANGDGSVMAWTENYEVEYKGKTVTRYHLYIGGEGGVDANQNCSYLFADYSNVTSIEFNGCFYTGNTVDMSCMFDSFGDNTEDLVIDISEFDTSNVTDMHAMFIYCESLVELNLSGIDISNVTNVYNMFRQCKALERINGLETLNTESITVMSYMFCSCTSLEEIDLSNFNIENVTEMIGMFSGCVSLVEKPFEGVDLTGIDTTDMYLRTQWDS